MEKKIVLVPDLRPLKNFESNVEQKVNYKIAPKCHSGAFNDSTSREPSFGGQKKLFRSGRPRTEK